MGLASTVILGVGPLDQIVVRFKTVYVFGNGASFSARGGLVFVSRHRRQQHSFEFILRHTTDICIDIFIDLCVDLRYVIVP
jgi:hypothetical protein